MYSPESRALSKRAAGGLFDKYLDSPSEARSCAGVELRFSRISCRIIQTKWIHHECLWLFPPKVLIDQRHELLLSSRATYMMFVLLFSLCQHILTRTSVSVGAGYPFGESPLHYTRSKANPPPLFFPRRPYLRRRYTRRLSVCIYRHGSGSSFSPLAARVPRRSLHSRIGIYIYVYICI